MRKMKDWTGMESAEGTRAVYYLWRRDGWNNGASGSFPRGHWERTEPLGVDFRPRKFPFTLGIMK